MNSNYITYGVGFSAQILFSARMIVQWITSEKAGRVVSPVIFWFLSLAGSFLLLIYGVFREDLVIVTGQIILYYIYIRNLELQKKWRPFPVFLRAILFCFPMMAFLWFSFGPKSATVIRLLHPKHITSALLIWGGIGQGIFLFRFVLQWLSSERQKTSVLPLQFWIFSLIGSSMLIAYAVFRRDPVLLIGQLFGTLIYTRNIIIHHRQIKIAAN